MGAQAADATTKRANARALSGSCEGQGPIYKGTSPLIPHKGPAPAFDVQYTEIE